MRRKIQHLIVHIDASACFQFCVSWSCNHSQGGTFFGCLPNPNLLLSEPKLCNKHKGESSQPKEQLPSYCRKWIMVILFCIQISVFLWMQLHSSTAALEDAKTASTIVERPLGTRWGRSFSVQSSTKHGYAEVAFMMRWKPTKRILWSLWKFYKVPQECLKLKFTSSMSNASICHSNVWNCLHKLFVKYFFLHKHMC